VNRIETIQAAFCCPKCKGRTAKVDYARLPFVGGRFPLKPVRFLVVTCALCGYTEFYDQSVHANEKESAEENGTAPARPATGNFSP